jgi:type II secretory pathway pseudopilin PulG
MEDRLLLNNKKNGYLIIESMIGISIVVVGLLGILAVSSRSISLNRVISDQFTANYLAAEGIEIVKNLIDANIIQGKPWNQGFSSGSFEADYKSLNLEPNQNRRLLFDAALNLYGYESGNPTGFSRTVNLELVGPDEIKVNSIVKWTTRGGGQFEINLEDHFFNWRP